MNSPDRMPVIAETPAATPGWALPASAGWLEIALPLWHRRWWLLLAALLGAAAGVGTCMFQPVRFTGQASFVVQPLLRPSQSVVASTLPALAGLPGAGGAAVELHLAILRSQAVSDRIIERFQLQRAWNLPLRVQAQMRLARRVSFGSNKRDGVVLITVEDDNPVRAATMANEYVEELRNTLRNFALEEARQRRKFLDLQLARARADLDAAQKKLQGSGFDRAALRAEPRAAAEAYGRLQAEVTAAEVRLAGTRRVRAEGSAEVQQQLSELAALRQQLGRLEVPRDDAAGDFVGRLREFRYAETLAESIARQAEAARVDEAGEATPLQVLDRALPPELPSGPNPLSWLLAGAGLAFAALASVVLVRHRMALSRLDPGHQQRLALIRSVLPRRRGGAP